MIYWVMSVFWKACGARLLSSQRERRGLKKTTGKLLLAFVFKGNSPLVYILPGRLFLNQFPSKMKRCFHLLWPSWAGQGLWEHATQLVMENRQPPPGWGFFPEVSGESAQIFLFNRSSHWSGSFFKWWSQKHLLAAWEQIKTEEPTCSRLFFGG